MVVLFANAILSSLFLAYADVGTSESDPSLGSQTLFVVSNAILWRGSVSGHEVDYNGATVIRSRLVQSLADEAGINAISPIDQLAGSQLSQWHDLFDILDLIDGYRQRAQLSERAYSLDPSFLLSPPYSDYDCIFVVHYRGYQRSLGTELLERTLEFASGQHRPDYLSNVIVLTPIVGASREVRDSEKLDAAGDLPEAAVSDITHKLIQEASQFEEC